MQNQSHKQTKSHKQTQSHKEIMTLSSVELARKAAGYQLAAANAAKREADTHKKAKKSSGTTKTKTVIKTTKVTTTIKKKWKNEIYCIFSIVKLFYTLYCFYLNTFFPFKCNQQTGHIPPPHYYE